MANRIMSYTKQTAQRGLSLIELLIALTLSTLLILGIVEIFASTRAAFAASEGLARAQENGRFAMDFFRRDLRMAGHMGCTNEFLHFSPIDDGFYHHFVDDGIADSAAAYPLRADLPVQVYDFTGSIPGAAYTIGSPNPAAASAGSAWTPALPAALSSEIIGSGSGAIIPGSDVIVVRYFDENSMQLVRGAALGEGGVLGTNGTIWTGPSTGSVAQFGVYGVTNCRDASLFQVTSVDVASGTVGSAGGENDQLTTGNYWHGGETYGVGAMMFRFHTVVYYVGRGSNAEGSPSLFRLALAESPSNSAEGVSFGTPEEVVEGVEFMQVLLSTAAPTAATGRVDDVTSYQTATALVGGVTDENELVRRLRRIGGMRISVLQRSPNPIPGGQPASPTIVVGDVIVTPPTDQRLRQVYDNLILVRNRQRA